MMNSNLPKNQFLTTRWTMISQATKNTPEASKALNELCETYWNPVFRFLYREGRNKDESHELTQAFFSKILQKGSINNVDPSKGRFRSYLIGALKNFLSNQKRAEKCIKRGGNTVTLSLDSPPTDNSPELQLPDPSAEISDTTFDREWALTIMKQGLDNVKNSLDHKKLQRFETLKPWLTGDSSELSQTKAAAKLGMTPSAVKVAIHRLRQQFGNAIRQEIADTVNSEEEIQDELRYLIEVLKDY